MLDDITDAINKNLPAQVGEVLRKRLADAALADKKIVEQGATINDLRQKITKLETENAAAQAILKREAELVAQKQSLDALEHAIGLRSAVLEAQSTLINSQLDRDERLLGLVFGNNRFKYREAVQETVAFPPTAPTAQNPYPCAQTGVQTRSVQIDGEGQVPAAPAAPRQ